MEIVKKIVKMGCTREEIICPFFGISDRLCEKGCGYVTEKEAGHILNRCLQNFDSCSKYLELTGDSSNSTYIDFKSKVQNLIKFF